MLNFLTFFFLIGFLSHCVLGFCMVRLNGELAGRQVGLPLGLLVEQRAGCYPGHSDSLWVHISRLAHQTFLHELER